jgi:hypothetical protein
VADTDQSEERNERNWILFTVISYLYGDTWSHLARQGFVYEPSDKNNTTRIFNFRNMYIPKTLLFLKEGEEEAR